MVAVIGHPKPTIFQRMQQGFRGLIGGNVAPRRQRPRSTWTQRRFGPAGPEIVAMAPSVGYGSADMMREIGGPSPTVASGDAHLRKDLDALVAESERFARNNTIYRAILKRLVDLVVGAGWTPQANTGDPSLDAKIEAAYEARSERMEIRGMDNALSFQRKAMWHALVDGRIGFVKDESTGLLQAVPGNRIWSLSAYAKNKNRIEHGVELDKLGRPLRFHIAQWDDYGLNRQDPVPVEAANFIYCSPTERFDETAAAPALQAIMPHLERLGLVCDNEVAAWEILSRWAMKITKKDGGKWAFNNSNQDDQRRSSYSQELTDRTVLTTWGYAFFAEEGEDIAGIDRNLPSPNFDATLRSFLRICGMEIGLSLPFFLLDWSDVNFSSGRAAAQQFWRNSQLWFDALRYILCEDYRWWIGREVAYSRLPNIPTIANHEWISDPFQPLDADKENAADRTAVQAGFKTNTRVLRERGIDRTDYLRERSIELSAAAEAVAAHNAKYPNCPVTIAQFLGEQPAAAEGGVA